MSNDFNDMDNTRINEHTKVDRIDLKIRNRGSISTRIKPLRAINCRAGFRGCPQR